LASSTNSGEAFAVQIQHCLEELAGAPLREGIERLDLRHQLLEIRPDRSFDLRSEGGRVPDQELLPVAQVHVDAAGQQGSKLPHRAA